MIKHLESNLINDVISIGLSDFGVCLHD